MPLPRIAAGAASEVCSTSLTLLAPPDLWSVRRPALYTLRTELYRSGQLLDAINTTVGLRTLRFDASEGLFLNDERVKVKGWCDHDSFGGVGTALPERVHLFKVQAIRALGGNGRR